MVEVYAGDRCKQFGGDKNRPRNSRIPVGDLATLDGRPHFSGLIDMSTSMPAIIRGEFGESAVGDVEKRAYLTPIVEDWLFDPHGRGARSRLPH